MASVNGMNERWLVTTENGRVYDIDLGEGMWSRSPHFRPRKTWTLQAGDRKIEPWNGGTWEDRMPLVGEHLYIGDRDGWFVSNVVVSIEPAGVEPEELEDAEELAQYLEDGA